MEDQIVREILNKLGERIDERNLHNGLIGLRHAVKLGVSWCEQPMISIDHLHNEIVLECVHRQMAMINGQRQDRYRLGNLMKSLSNKRYDIHTNTTSVQPI
jgi:hypothetical protein